MAKRVDLLNGNIASSLTRLAFPLMGISCLQIAYNLTDIFWIGKLGAGAVAAVGTGGLLLWLSQGIHTLAQLGGQVLVAQKLGAHKSEEAGMYAHAAIWMSISISLILGCIFYFGVEPIVSIFGLNDPIVIQEAQIYIKVTCGMVIFMLLAKLLTALITTTGDSRTPLKATMVGLVFNMILDPVLIFGYFGFPEMGVFGAALATIIAQMIVLLILVLHCIKDQHLFCFVRMNKAPNVNACTRILRLSIPTALQNTLFPLISIYMANLTAGFGDTAVAAQRIGSQVESVSWMATDGFAMAVNSFVAQNYGAKNMARAKKGAYQAILMLGVYGLFTSVFLIFGAKAIYQIFLDDAQVIEIGINYLVIVGFTQVFLCFEILSSAILNAFGKTLYPAFIATVFTGMRIPLALFLISTALGLNGIWFALSISTLFKGVLLLGVVLYFLRKIQVPENELVKEVETNS